MERFYHRNGYRLAARVLGSFFASVSLLMLNLSPAAASSSGPTASLIIDGKGVRSDVKPYVSNGRMLLPMRTIAQHTNASISYNAHTKRVSVKTDKNKVALFVGKSFAYVNGKKMRIDAPPRIVRGRTMVPLRFLSQAFRYQLRWYPSSQVAIIQTGKSKHAAVKSPILSAKTISVNAHEKTLLNHRFVFPFGDRSKYTPFYNSYGDGRSWTKGIKGTGRIHEGIDIMAEKGTPVYAASSGVVNRIGWNSYGGWRINITDSSGKYKFYYAHLESFVPSLRAGSWVAAGQLIGFVGDSGYGAPGTVGKFSPHLHFGLYYKSNNKAFNPYYYLKQWERNKIHN